MDSGDVIDTGDLTPAGEGDSTSPAPRDYEAEARQHGWTPKDDFRGDAAKWVDAETFVKRADEVMPFLKKQNAALKREMDDLKRTMKQFQAFASKAEERAYTRAMTDLQARHDEAVETGDVAGARKVMKEITELKADVPAAPTGSADDPAADAPADAQQQVKRWIDSSPYYMADEAKTRYADLQSDDLIKEHGALHRFPGGLEAALKEIDARVSRKFADKPPVQNAGGGNRGGAKGGRSYADLPPEAKRQCDRFVKSIPGFTKEQYVKDYSW
jgi:hypothetical protein